MTADSGTWSNISFDDYNNEYEYYDYEDYEYYTIETENEAKYNALPVDPMNIVGTNSGSDTTRRRLAGSQNISNPSFPTLTVSSGHPKVTF